MLRSSLREAAPGTSPNHRATARPDARGRHVLPYPRVAARPFRRRSARASAFELPVSSRTFAHTVTTLSRPLIINFCDCWLRLRKSS